MKDILDMKQSLGLIITLSFLFFCNQLTAKQIIQTEKSNKILYAGLGAGFNDSGISLGLEIPIFESIAIYGNFGTSGWGGRLGGGLYYYPSWNNYKVSYGVGLSYANGFDNFTPSLTTKNGNTIPVTIDLNKLLTLNFTYSYHKRIAKKSKLIFSTGYAFSLSNNPYKIKDSNINLADSSLGVMKIMEPGGLILGIKFMFGFWR